MGAAPPFGTDPAAFSLNWPGAAQFGPGAVMQLPQLLAGRRRPLIVTDRGIVAGGLLAPVLAALRGQGLAPTVFSDVEANPSLTHVDDALAAWRHAGSDALVAFGGGSAIDTAKLVVARLCSDIPVSQLLARGDAALTRPPPRFIAVPTTAGTGSESTLAAVVKDSQGRKHVMRSATTRPQHVLLDPELTLSVPAAVTASTGFDVAMHALGAATNRANSPVAALLAQRALAQAVEWLPRVLEAPHALPARSAMLEASYLAGVAIGLKGVDAIHGLATPLESVARAPHGHVLAVVMEPVLRFTAETEGARYAELARACGWPAHGLVPILCGLRERCGLPSRLSQIGVQASQLPGLVDAAAQGPSTRLHARTPSHDDVQALYAAML